MYTWEKKKTCSYQFGGIETGRSGKVVVERTSVQTAGVDEGRVLFDNDTSILLIWREDRDDFP